MDWKRSKIKESEKKRVRMKERMKRGQVRVKQRRLKGMNEERHRERQGDRNTEKE